MSNKIGKSPSGASVPSPHPANETKPTPRRQAEGDTFAAENKPAPSNAPSSGGPLAPMPDRPAGHRNNGVLAEKLRTYSVSLSKSEKRRTLDAIRLASKTEGRFGRKLDSVKVADHDKSAPYQLGRAVLATVREESPDAFKDELIAKDVETYFVAKQIEMSPQPPEPEPKQKEEAAPKAQPAQQTSARKAETPVEARESDGGRRPLVVALRAESLGVVQVGPSPEEMLLASVADDVAFLHLLAANSALVVPVNPTPEVPEAAPVATPPLEEHRRPQTERALQRVAAEIKKRIAELQARGQKGAEEHQNLEELRLQVRKALQGEPSNPAARRPG